MTKENIVTYDEFCSPKIEAKNNHGNITASINVPATGPVELTVDELNELAHIVENAPNSIVVQLIVGNGNKSEFAKSLRDTAYWIEQRA